MHTIEIKVENDHIQRLTTARPISAISELIWNAYDADARKVIIEIEAGAVTKLGLIRVIDNGTGIPAGEVDGFFQSLGGSWKKKVRRTNSGRAIHGEKGQGRFKAFALGDRVSWISHHAGMKFSISGDKADLKKFAISETVPTSDTGCTVQIENIPKDFEVWAEDGFADDLPMPLQHRTGCLRCSSELAGLRR